MIEIPKDDAQILYEIMLLNPRFHCTCDEVVRETEIFQAQGHYHHCMLWQVAHAIELSYRYFKKDPTLFEQENVQKIIASNKTNEMKK